jgi:hypothetical protein
MNIFTPSKMNLFKKKKNFFFQMFGIAIFVKNTLHWDFQTFIFLTGCRGTTLSFAAPFSDGIIFISEKKIFFFDSPVRHHTFICLIFFLKTFFFRSRFPDDFFTIFSKADGQWKLQGISKNISKIVPMEMKKSVNLSHWT